MAAAKITPASKAPEGGRIEMAGGKPSGVFVDAAMRLVDSAKPKPLARDLDRALYLAQQQMLELGITTIADIGPTIEEWQAYRRAGDKTKPAEVGLPSIGKSSVTTCTSHWSAPTI